jgi:hypothetical protein
VGLPGVTFAQIAKGESGYQPGAIGHDPGGTKGLGLWQITTKYNDDIIEKFGGRKAMLDPVQNAKAAKAIYDRQGIKAWYGTRYMTHPKKHYKGKGVPPTSGGPNQLATRQVMDQESFDSANDAAQKGALLASFLQKRNPDSLLLKSGALGGEAPNPGDFLKTIITQKQNVRKPKPVLGTTGGRNGKVKAGGGPVRGVKDIAKLAQQMGLNVGEHPDFGGVAPVHAKNSYHYRKRAIDVSGDPEKMRRFANEVAKRHGKRVAELFWRGSGHVNIKHGKHVGKDFVSGHETHVHVAV